MNESAQPSLLVQRCWSVLLVMCLIQFSGAWIYPPTADSMADLLHIEKMFGVQYQYTLWACIMAGFFVHVHMAGIGDFFKVVRVVLPFWLIGTIAGVFGYDPFSSTRAVLLWALMATSAACVGTTLPGERIIKVLCGTLAVILLLSIVLSVAFPAVGLQVYGFKLVWRGAFVGKNILGWAASLTLVINVAAMRRTNLRWTGSAALLGFICLVGSDSKGAAVSAFATLGYLYIIVKFSRSLKPSFGVAVVLFLMVVAGIFAFMVSPVILEALGRDATLTGRTDVWSLFFNSMIRTPWLGQGPGAYSGLSPLTVPLAAQLTSLGTIVTPHNVFLGVLGDTGLFGLVIFIITVFYLALVLPLTRPGKATMMCASVGFLIMAHGMVETHEVLLPGLGWFLLILSYSIALKEHKQAAPAVASEHAGIRAEMRAEMRYAATRAERLGH